MESSLRRHMKPLILTSIALAVLGNSISSAQAQNNLPIATRHLNPFILPYSSAAALTSATDPVAPGSFTSNVRLFLANNSITMENANEQITLDGESYVTDLKFRFGYNSRIELAASIPLIYHNDGFLDNAIEKWHDWLGLSNGRRNDFASNQLLYQYRKNGITLYETADPEGGLGDIVLSSQYKPLRWNTPTRTLAYQADLKLPTGQANKLTGTDATDISLSIHATDRQIFSTLNVALYGGAAISYLGDGDILPDQQENTVYSAYLGSVWQFHRAFNIKGQLDYHSAFYDSDLVVLGSDSVALYLSGTYQPSHHLNFELGFGENLQTDPTPDFILYFAMNYTPHYK
ncbi:MAG: DUF3187 family protein [Gammaproteobacteria bacterium]